MSDITLGRLRGGFCVSWTDASGKRRRHQLKSRTAKEAQAEAIIVYKKHSSPDRPPITVEYIWQMYVTDLGEKPTAKTMGYTGKSVIPHFGHLDPMMIVRKHCTEYQNRQLDRGKSIGSVWTELGHLQSALHWAEKSRLIEKAPHIWRPPKPETDKRNLKTYEPESQIDFSTVDREDFLDSLCDQQVTSVGLAHMLDLDILGALQHVADSNDSKFDADGFPVFDENQKIIKGPNYFAPDLRPFLNDARYA